MKLRIPALLLTPLLFLTACILPPSMLPRAAYGPPDDYWQNQGRYKQTADGLAPEGGVPARPGPQAAPFATDPLDPTRVDPWATSATPGSEPPLHAWDGGIVDGAPQGAVTERDGAPRGLEEPPEGRMHIIELYQQVLDERDALAQELELVRKQLAQTTQALETKTSEAGDLTVKVSSLEASHKELLADNHAISARLVTAQIRRLEAEKLLLETRIQIEEARAEEAAQSQQRAGAGKKASASRAPAKPEGGPAAEGEKE